MAQLIKTLLVNEHPVSAPVQILAVFFPSYSGSLLKCAWESRWSKWETCMQFQAPGFHMVIWKVNQGMDKSLSFYCFQYIQQYWNLHKVDLNQFFLPMQLTYFLLLEAETSLTISFDTKILDQMTVICVWMLSYLHKWPFSLAVKMQASVSGVPEFCSSACLLTPKPWRQWHSYPGFCHQCARLGWHSLILAWASVQVSSGYGGRFHTGELASRLDSVCLLLKYINKYSKRSCFH